MASGIISCMTASGLYSPATEDSSVGTCAARDSRVGDSRAGVAGEPWAAPAASPAGFSGVAEATASEIASAAGSALSEPHDMATPTARTAMKGNERLNGPSKRHVLMRVRFGTERGRL